MRFSHVKLGSVLFNQYPLSIFRNFVLAGFEIYIYKDSIGGGSYPILYFLNDFAYVFFAYGFCVTNEHSPGLGILFE